MLVIGKFRFVRFRSFHFDPIQSTVNIKVIPHWIESERNKSKYFDEKQFDGCDVSDLIRASVPIFHLFRSDPIRFSEMRALVTVILMQMTANSAGMWLLDWIVFKSVSKLCYHNIFVDFFWLNIRSFVCFILNSLCLSLKRSSVLRRLSKKRSYILFFGITDNYVLTHLQLHQIVLILTDFISKFWQEVII